LRFSFSFFCLRRLFLRQQEACDRRVLAGEYFARRLVDIVGGKFIDAAAPVFKIGDVKAAGNGAAEQQGRTLQAVEVIGQAGLFLALGGF
jgi:hypothetical protein